MISEECDAQEGVRQFGIPFTTIAAGLPKPVVKNVVALGALQAATGLFPKETFFAALHQALHEKPQFVKLNEEAFVLGQEAVEESVV